MHITARDGAKLFVKEWGAGAPVILIHGWPLSADSWDDVALPLADAGRRVIAYDRRGFGRSEQTWTGYDYNSLTDRPRCCDEGNRRHGWRRPGRVLDGRG